ncbi:MAG TPA: hypothetical protein VEJ18_19305 [Planctomycetota bacterium]|nr:hypothetical protein [Planctomycetota bacterium]
MEEQAQLARLEAMEREKQDMISRYMNLQDQADALNEEIYKVCCGVETLNARIDALKAEINRAAAKAAAGAPPANGNGRSNGKH